MPLTWAGNVSTLPFDQFTRVGYAAIFAPGRPIWEEFDLRPGHHLAPSYVSYAESGMPALMRGVVQPFVVASDDATPGASPEA